MTEEEQLAHLRDWWQRHGRSVTIGAGLAIVLVLGWQFWQSRASASSVEASAAYQALVTAAFDSGTADNAQLVDLAAQLQAEQPGSHYAQFAALFMAKVAVQTDRLPEAERQLRSIVNAPADPVLAELGRQRLARVLAANDQLKEGLKLLEGEALPAFAASRAELRGDLLLQQGDREAARTAYLSARDALSADAAAGTLQLKIDDLAPMDTDGQNAPDA